MRVLFFLFLFLVGSIANSQILYIQCFLKIAWKIKSRAIKNSQCFPPPAYRNRTNPFAANLPLENPTMRKLEKNGLHENLIETEISATFFVSLTQLPRALIVFDLTKENHPFSGNMIGTVFLTNGQRGFIATD